MNAKELIRRFLFEEGAGGGQAAGTMEIDSTPLAEAREFADELFRKYQGKSLDEAIPNFDKNYLRVQVLASLGKTRRRDMPVITPGQVKDLQRRLKEGYVDVREPFAPGTSPADPFPEGLSGEEAEFFLENGLRDGSKPDDVVSVSNLSERASNLKPIQRQIYFDKSITSTAKNGVEATKKFLQGSYMVASEDGFIIDGHHRWLSANLIDPSMTMRGIKIDLPMNELLPLARAYGDALGNARNM